MPNFIFEHEIEDALLLRLQLHDYEVLVCRAQVEDLDDGSGRSHKRDIFLVDRLKEAAIRLNSGIPVSVIDEALAELIDRRQAMSVIAANRAVYNLLRDGIDVEFDNAQGQKQQERVQVIDFNRPEENRYLAVSQMWLKGERGYRRPDVLLYVNGIPLVFIELKNSNIKLKTAYEENIVNYRAEIPQVFLANAFCILSNGIETKVGSFTAEWEYFYPWLRVEKENEKINRAQIKDKG
ncbi:deoxyribonuclease, partial [bacterium]|nr:deoxyribonuclease [bacterium]